MPKLRLEAFDLGTSVAYVCFCQDGNAAFSCLGKGRSPAAKSRSALAEAVERWHFRRDLPDRGPVPARKLDGPAVDPRDLGLFAEEQYRRRLIPWKRYHRDLPITWRRAVNLHSGRRVYLPHEFRRRTAGLNRGTTTGWAAHSDLDAATAHALLEVVERDAVQLWWHGRAPAGRLRLPQLPEVRRLQKEGWTLTLLALSTELGVPVVAVVGRFRGKSPLFRRGAAMLESAAGLSRDAAVGSALAGFRQGLELWQLLGDALPAKVRRLRPDTVREPLDHALLYLDPVHGRALAARTARQSPAPRARSLRGLKGLLAALKRAGYSAYRTEATRPFARALGLCVVRVAVPGTLAPSFGPARRNRFGNFAARLDRLGVKRVELPLDDLPCPS